MSGKWKVRGAQSVFEDDPMDVLRNQIDSIVALIETTDEVTAEMRTKAEDLLAACTNAETFLRELEEQRDRLDAEAAERTKDFGDAVNHGLDQLRERHKLQTSVSVENEKKRAGRAKGVITSKDRAQERNRFVDAHKDAALAQAKGDRALAARLIRKQMISWAAGITGQRALSEKTIEDRI
ncbi:hypothetical protein [Ruegeria arenilitoris]|uniref:hypothetical protein n=1 Tax=Ruegeria arenilitoris TaxID=1173585 RepID=UPI00147AFAA6|nr:hypothetical protein [Ruegeria arenilitoris]